MNLSQAVFPELQTPGFLLQTTRNILFTTPHTLSHSHLSYLEIKSPGMASRRPCRALILISCSPSCLCLCPRAFWSPAGLCLGSVERNNQTEMEQDGSWPWEGWDAELHHSQLCSRKNQQGCRSQDWTAWLPPWTWKCSKCCAKLRLHPGGGGDSIAWERWEKQEILGCGVASSLQKNQT